MKFGGKLVTAATQIITLSTIEYGTIKVKYV